MSWLALLLGFSAEPVVWSSGPVSIDWTGGVIQVEARMIQPATVWSDVRATEKDARRKLQTRLQDSALAVPFGRDGDVSDLMGKWEDVDSALSVGLADGMGHWRVVETRYFTSGRVELVGELDLTEWLRPYATRVASAPHDAPNETMRSTGIVVDARHLDLAPSYAPRLIDSDGRVVYDLASLSKDVASIRMPSRSA